MLNQCQFIGNLGADPECRRTQAGSPVVNLSLACTEKWRDKQGEQKERTEWVRCVIFSEGLCKVAEQYLRKGSKVYISGKMSTRKWQDQQGQDKYTTEIVLSNFDSKLFMLDSPKDGNTSQGQSGSYGDYGKASGGESSGSRPGANDLDDEIPFAPEVRG